MDILIRPLVTEKSMKDAAKNRYTFAVSKDANKNQIIQIVAETFNVKPVSISTIMVHGKSKMNKNSRQISKAENWKKAIVTLAAGQKIDIFDVTEGGKNA